MGRGDQAVTVNGRAAADLIAANDFSAFEAGASGERLTLVLRRAGIDRTVVPDSGACPAGTGQVTGTPPPSARALFVEPGVRGALLER